MNSINVLYHPDRGRSIPIAMPKLAIHTDKLYPEKKKIIWSRLDIATLAALYVIRSKSKTFETYNVYPVCVI